MRRITRARHQQLTDWIDDGALAGFPQSVPELLFVLKEIVWRYLGRGGEPWVDATPDFKEALERSIRLHKQARRHRLGLED